VFPDDLREEVPRYRPQVLVNGEIGQVFSTQVIGNPSNHGGIVASERHNR